MRPILHEATVFPERKLEKLRFASDDRRRVLEFLLHNNLCLEHDVQLSNITYMKTGGVAKILVYPKNAEQMTGLLSVTCSTNTPIKIVGATSNLLFLDDASYNFLISTSKMSHVSYDSANSQLVVDAGVALPELSRIALYKSIGGFAGLEGIPGTVGGAIWMNAGAYGYEIKDTLLAADIASLDGEVRQYSAAELGLAHRSSALRRKELEGVILRSYFAANYEDSKKTEKAMEVFHAKRHKYQDFLYPNLGSIFSGSPYRSLGRRDLYFRAISSLYYLFSYKIKLFRRESPINRKWLNNIAVRRFGIEFDVQPFSDKTLNCLVNRGQGTVEMIKYVELMSQLTEYSIPLENEIVYGF